MSSFRRTSEDLHGNAPDRSRAALLIVDMINDLDFPANQELLRQSKALGRNIANLKSRCRQAGIPAIYINDNRGRWRSDFDEVIRFCTRPESLGREMVQQILPAAEDYLILKPKHSIFFATPLDVLLEYMGVESLVLTGLSTNSCILLSASDAHVRDYQLFVPADCVAGQTEEDHRTSLVVMEKNFSAITIPASEIRLDKLLSAREQQPAA